MSQQQGVSMLAQTSEGELVSKGSGGSGHHKVIIDETFSLLGLAGDHAEQPGTLASLALEILLDDMRTNLSSREYEQATGFEKHVITTRCIQESFENINDYLISQANPEDITAGKNSVSLCALQITQGQCSFIHASDHCCMHYRHEKLVDLSKKDKATTLLGLSSHPSIGSTEVNVSNRDILFICDMSLLQILDDEYLRVTLSRFQDSPEMAIRQINSRALRAGMQSKPIMALVTVSLQENKSKSWFKR